METQRCGVARSLVMGTGDRWGAVGDGRFQPGQLILVRLPGQAGGKLGFQLAAKLIDVVDGKIGEIKKLLNNATARASETRCTNTPPPGPVRERTSPCASSRRMASRMVPLAMAKRAINSASLGRRCPGCQPSSITHCLIASATRCGRERRPAKAVSEREVAGGKQVSFDRSQKRALSPAALCCQQATLGKGATGRRIEWLGQLARRAAAQRAANLRGAVGQQTFTGVTGRGKVPFCLPLFNHGAVTDLPEPLSPAGSARPSAGVGRAHRAPCRPAG